MSGRKVVLLLGRQLLSFNCPVNIFSRPSAFALNSLIFRYLPYDRTGDWLYQATESISFCLAGSIVYQCRVRYKDSYEGASDTLNHLYLIIPAFLLALLFHPSLNAFMPADVRKIHTEIFLKLFSIASFSLRLS